MYVDPLRPLLDGYRELAATETGLAALDGLRRALRQVDGLLADGPARARAPGLLAAMAADLARRESLAQTALAGRMPTDGATTEAAATEAAATEAEGPCCNRTVAGVQRLGTPVAPSDVTAPAVTMNQ